MSPYIDLKAAGLSEWTNPASAATADYGSTCRVQAVIIAACLKLTNDVWDEEDRMTQRRLKEQFDLYHKTGILVASKLRAERGDM